ncbi:gag protein [Tanacetum coccineum]
MYTTFTHARKDVPHHSLPTSRNPSGEPWNSDSEEAHPSKALGKIVVENDEVEPILTNPLDANNTKGKGGLKVLANLKAYNGMSDPDDHLTVFMGTMDIHKLPESVWCRFFPITLCGAARFWYENLASGSIDGFHQLRDKFRANFSQQRQFQKTQAEILGIRQRPDECLKDYVTRFSKETLHMADRSDAMVSGAFISGL